LNERHPLLIYADDINLLSEGINTTNKNLEFLLAASKETDLVVNAKKAKYNS
jgi:hypothetical protein